MPIRHSSLRDSSVLLARAQTGGPARVSTALLVAGLAAGVAIAQPTITNLGTFAGGTSSFANGISANGLVVTGSSDGPPVSHAFRWTAAGGMQDLGIIGNGNYSTGGALSADGSVVVGISAMPSGQNRAFRWTAATGMASLGVLNSGSASNANAVNADGSVVTGGSYTSGYTNFRAFRWTAPTGLQNIGTLPGGQAPDPFGISADGSVIVGVDNVSGYSRAFRWMATGGMQDLGILPTADSALAHAVNADGSTAVGYSGDQLDATWNHAFRWTSATGMQDLGVLPGSVVSVANAVSADGSVIVGFSTLPDDDHAMLWTSSLGMVELGAYLAAQGTNITGWALESATGISADGSAIAGYGTFNGAPRAFLVHGPALTGTCSPHWLAGVGVPGLDFPGSLEITAYTTTAWDPDGPGPLPPVVVVGGAFNSAGGVPANNIAIWSPVTGAWSALGSGMDFRVTSLLSVPNGAGGNDLIAGGDFFTAGGAPANKIARWNGATWSPLGTGMAGGALGRVAALAILPNGDLVAGGSFSTAGGTAAINIARWNGAAWSPLGPGIVGNLVRSLAVGPSGVGTLGGKLVVGGDFTTAGGAVANGIAVWDDAGAAWSALGSGMPLPVESLAFQSNGDLIAGGRFSTAGGVAANRIARWNGAAWSALGSGVSSECTSVVVRSNDDVIAGGVFATAGGVAAHTVARWNGSAWLTLGSGVAGTPSTASNPIVQGLSLLPSGDLVVVGDLNGEGGVAANDVAVYTFATPAIAAQPNSATVCSGNLATFSTLAAGTGPFTYRWAKGGTAINAATNPSATTATLVIPNSQHTDAGLYACTISNTCSSVTSAPAKLSVNSADFNNDGDTGTDQDIDAFFACLSGNCCPACGSVDFNGDGDIGTDQDIDAFFRVLAGGSC